MAENTASNDFSEKTINDLELHIAAIGKSGTLIQSDVVANEYLPELSGVKAQEIYDTMLRSDSQIRKLYHSVNNSIKSAKWDIEPASNDANDIKVAALIKHIIFKNIPDGFKNKLDEILLFPWHGHSVFEVIHNNYTDDEFGPYTGLKTLGFRDQRTLTKWKYKDDELVEIYQEQQGDEPINVWMKRSTLLIFFNEKKGNDNGFPFLRMLYGNYKRKLLYKQLQAIGMERGAIAVPMLKVPKEVKHESEAWAVAEEQLRAYTQAENAYFMYPEGYELDFNQTNSFDPAKAQVAIKAENEEIAGSLVAMFLEMGIGGNSGNQAGTEVSAAFFRDGIKYIADKVADPINLYLIPNLVRLNFGNTVKVMPKLVHAGITDQAGKELMEIITGYTKAGVVQVDEPLEDYVRKQHDLPKKAIGEMLDNKAAANDTNNSPDKNSPTPPNGNNTVNKNTPEVKLNEGGNDPVVLFMRSQAEKITNVIKDSVRFSGSKFIADTITRAKQLPANKRQSATSKVTVGGQAKFKSALKSVFAETMGQAIEQAKKEISKPREIKLSSSEFDMKRMRDTYGNIDDIKLNEFSKFPTHVQILLSKQVDLITQASLDEVTAKLSFVYSSIETKTNDLDVIEQNMDEALDDFVDASIAIKGENVSALLTNEARNSVFFDEDNLDSVASYTFMNDNPKSKICIELTGTTFAANDAESLRYCPPLHHNCKSYLRANLKTSKGVDKLTVSTLSPSADAIKGMTL